MKTVKKILSSASRAVGILCLSFLICSCGQGAAEELPLGEANENPADSADTTAETEEETSEEEAEEAPGLPVIGEREIKSGKMQSYLTGEWIEKEKATRRPIAVMIPNNKPAMPQYGLSKAAIIYEAPVEDCRDRKSVV